MRPLSEKALRLLKDFKGTIKKAKTRFLGVFTHRICSMGLRSNLLSQNKNGRKSRDTAPLRCDLSAYFSGSEPQPILGFRQALSGLYSFSGILCEQPCAPKKYLLIHFHKIPVFCGITDCVPLKQHFHDNLLN